MKTVLSFYVDDTNPYVAPPEAFKTFLDFVAGEGAAGESSAILGYDWEQHGHLKEPAAVVEEAYFEQLRRAFDCRVDTHCELYTHWGLFDFAAGRLPGDAIHEGLWLYEPGVSVQAYEDYFSHILAEGERNGFRYTGVTWPGCGCPACTKRYQELSSAGVNDPNPRFWQALLNLAKAGRFRGRTVPCFFGGEVEAAEARLEAGEGVDHSRGDDGRGDRGRYGIFSLPPNAADRFGLWLNDPQYVSADYYISADGQSGRIVDLVRAAVPYCLFYTHWQGLNPANGVGWQAFTQVIGRVQRYLKDQVVWMRPSEYTDGLI